MTPSEFAIEMQRELDNNQQKGDFSQWHPSPAVLLAELHHHTAKLHMAISNCDYSAMREHSADLGNISMKACEIAIEAITGRKDGE